MNKEKILVYDDEPEFRKNYAESLSELKIVKEKFDIETLDDDKFIEEMEILKGRQQNLRRGKSKEYKTSIFDDVSIFIIDFELIDSSEPGFMLSGEDVAYYARCYSRCGLILGLNGFLLRRNIFDLTLKGNPGSFADLNINSEQLNNPGLWGGETKSFRPWHWPDLPRQLTLFRKQIEDVKEHLDSPICDTIGIPKEVVEVFSRAIGEFIGDNPHETTFKDFITKSPNVLRGKDYEGVSQLDEESIGRIVASRLSKWLERLVLTGQDILVDAPHLVTWYPSLLNADHTKVENWDMTAKIESIENLNLDTESIEEFRLEKDYWLSRPVWFWNQISDCQNIKEVSEPWSREENDFVFCEDISRFDKIEKCKDFIATLDSSYDRRFVRDLDEVEVEFSPERRLSSFIG